jgi:hypothetical protein
MTANTQNTTIILCEYCGDGMQQIPRKHTHIVRLNRASTGLPEHAFVAVSVPLEYQDSIGICRKCAIKALKQALYEMEQS